MAEGGVRHYTEWTPRLINRSRYECEDESKETNIIMDILGYGSIIRQRRREAFKETDEVTNAHMSVKDIYFTAGSKAEGLTRVFESDTDRICVLPNTVCLEEGVDESLIPGHIINVFKMNMHSCNAGYCKVQLERLDPLGDSVFTDSLCDDGYGRILMSSTCFVEHYRKVFRVVDGGVDHGRAGPSLPCYDGVFKHDFVIALRCDCPAILHKWASRVRHWPPLNIVEKVIAMRAFVTPIGFKGSEHNHVEWRICFNTAETELVNNLYDTHIKVYVLLKMIVNDVLKPQSKEITSYTLKNIVLWLAESNPQVLFHPGSLLHWLHEGLDVLRTAISVRQLPYFMIPERNLMAERELDVEQQRVWVSSITDMMNDGPRILLRLKRIRQAVVCHPQPLLWYIKMRTELEITVLEYFKRGLRFADRYGQIYVTDTFLQALKKRNGEIVNEVPLAYAPGRQFSK